MDRQQAERIMFTVILVIDKIGVLCNCWVIDNNFTVRCQNILIVQWLIKKKQQTNIYLLETQKYNT